MNASLIKKYLKASGVSFVAKLCVSLSGIGVLFILNQAMDKDGFGLFMLSFAICFLLASVVAGFFQSLILYHISRGHEDKHIDRFSAFWGPVIGCSAAAALYGAAPFVATIMGKPDLVAVLQPFVWFIPCYVLVIVLSCAHRARQHVAVMLSFQEIAPSVLKIVFLALAWRLALSAQWFAYGFAGSYFISAAALMIWKPLPLVIRPKGLSWWDVRYGGMISFNQIINKSTRNLLTVFIGFFASAGIVAEVVIALRLSQFLLMPKLMLAQLHVPRIGRALAEGKQEDLMKEFHLVRGVSLLLTLVGTLAFAFLGPFFLSVFGDYAHVFPLLMVLCAASIVRAGFGDIGGFLSMAGHSAQGVAANVVSLIALLVPLSYCLNLYGAYGAGLALYVSALAGMGMIAWLLKRHEGVSVLPPFIIGILFVAIASVFVIGGLPHATP